jgi:hypothetical protein
MDSALQTLPLFLLPSDAVLLPGVTVQIRISQRPDVFPLLSSLFSRPSNLSPALRSSPANSSVAVGCVHLLSASNSVGPRALLKGIDLPRGASPQWPDIGPDWIKNIHFRECGVTAKVLGVHGGGGGGDGEPVILLQGIRRMRLVSVRRDGRLVDGKVVYHDGDGKKSAL